MLHTFRLDLGDYDTGAYNSLEIFIYIVAVLIVPLVMLNMLIVIMGNTYDRVKEKEDRRDLQELANLVMKYEIIATALCKRK